MTDGHAEELNPLPESICGYRPLYRIGAGAMAEAIVAIDERLGPASRPVVLKRLTTHDEIVLQHFQLEAELSLRLTHPNVVAAQALLEEPGAPAPVLVLEHVDGEPLALLREPLFDMDDGHDAVAALCCQLLAALEYVHTARDDQGEPLNIVHRDVKPGNMIVTPAGDLKLLDFGVAKWAKGERTEVQTVKGTLRYTSPEYLAGEEATQALDLWAVAIIAWEFIAGRRLFHAPHPAQLVAAILHEEVPDLRDLARTCPPELADAIAKGLNRDPAERHQTATQFRRALEDAADIANGRQQLRDLMMSFGASAKRRRRHLKERIRATFGSDASISVSFSGVRARSSIPSASGTSAVPAEVEAGSSKSKAALAGALLLVAALGGVGIALISSPTDAPREAAAPPESIGTESAVPEEAEPEGER
ncbi:MAG: serine/threonine-protein kinase, partial [Myxococcota bacterium]